MSKIEFVFQVFNRVNTIREMLIPFVKPMGGVAYDVTVYDDGSTDGTREEIKSVFAEYQSGDRRKFELRETESWFETEITHDAFCRTRSEFVSLMQDDDYYADLRFADDAIDILFKNPHISALSPKHGLEINADMSIKRLYGWYNSSDLPIVDPGIERGEHLLVDIVDRAPMIIRRSAYDRIGGVDRDLLIGGYNDWDMCIRWLKEHMPVAIYKTDGYEFRKWDAGSLRKESKITREHGNNRAKVFAKHQDFLRAMA